MSYVIQRYEDGQFVRPPGSANSYTRTLQNARQFPTREAAEREKCGNETVLSLASAMLTRGD